MSSEWPTVVTGESLAERFVAAPRPTFGLEEEIMVLDPQTLDLLPRGIELLEGLDSRFKKELPAAHVEIASSPATNIDDLAAEMFSCRRLLALHVEGRARLAVAGVHPFSARSGQLNAGERYERMLTQYGDPLRQQLVCGLHLHLSGRSADSMLALYNAYRSYLPDLAALAANAPIYCGEDTTLASVRPLIAGLLPRMGVPPVIESWDDFAAQLNWGMDTGRMGRPAEWWWDLRLHPGLGTLEIRVPDGQVTAEDAVAVGTVALGIAVWLADRIDAVERLRIAPEWQIRENRWSALRGGMDSDLIDLETGAVFPARERIARLLHDIAPTVETLGGSSHLDRARELVDFNGADRQRKVFAGGGAVAVTEWLAGRFLPELG